MEEDALNQMANADIVKLKDMFPDTPVPIIQSTYKRNNCILMDTCEELLLTSLDKDVQSSVEDLPGTSGGAQGKYQDDDVIRIDEEDDEDDKTAKDSEFSLKISFDKLSYLQGIFPDVQILYLKRTLKEIGDDDSKFQVFLNECLADPKRLPRGTRVVPAVKRVRQSDDNPLEYSFSSIYNMGRAMIRDKLFEVGLPYSGTKSETAQRLYDYYQAAANAGLQQEADDAKESSSSKKPRMVGKGKGLMKTVNSHSGDHPDDFECSLCQCGEVVKWVKCEAGCIFCNPCFTKRFHDQLLKDVTNIECFMKCGEMFSNETLKNHLAPVLYLELVVADYDCDTDDENNDADGNANQIPILNNNQDPKESKANEDEIVVEDKSNEEDDGDVEVDQPIPNPKPVARESNKASISSSKINLSVEIEKFDKLRCPQCKFSGKMTHNQQEVRCNKCKKSSCRSCLGAKGPRHLCSDVRIAELKAEMEHDLLRLAILSQTNPRDSSLKDLVEDSINELQMEDGKAQGRAGARPPVPRQPQSNQSGIQLNKLLTYDTYNVLKAKAYEHYLPGSSPNGWRTSHKTSQKNKDKEIIRHLGAIYSDIDMFKICTSTQFLNECVQLLEQSALIPFIETMMDSCNFLEIGNHSDVYKVLNKILKILCQKTHFNGLLAELPGQKVSIQQLLEKLGKAAKVIMDKVSGADVGVAQDIYDLSRDASEALRKGDKLVNLFDEDQGKDAASSSDECEIMELDEEPEKTEDYLGALGPLQYDDSVSFQGVTLKHAGKALGKKTVLRIAHELSSFATGSTLPCSASSSIFVRSDNSQMNFVKAVITGPSDSPYMGGIYEFDIEFPPTYPSVPPLVTFRTTAGGRVRFNPNLYACGKVCLSLLGTWSGEKWIPNTSTLLQVLVSIQSLVLVAEPYYNEPAYAGGNHPTQSKNYNKNVFINNLKHAILEQLTAPPQGFEEVVRTHFYYRRESLIKELDEYVKQFGTTANKTKESSSPPALGSNSFKPTNHDQIMAKIMALQAKHQTMEFGLMGATGLGANSSPTEGELSGLVSKVKKELSKLEKPAAKTKQN